MDEIVYAYKLFRVRPNGTLGPLFINRRLVIKPGVWMQAETIPTSGFAVRHGWHATLQPVAPHLKEKLASGERRVWVPVALRGVTRYDRPESQGGTWLLAQELKVVND